MGAVESARFAALIELMGSHHPHQEHFYLWFLGVSTSVQNQGLGSTLLRSGLDRCDEHSVPAYLEATTDRNRGLYERHGFHVTGELTANGSPPMWAMWRDQGTAEPNNPRMSAWSAGCSVPGAVLGQDVRDVVRQRLRCWCEVARGRRPGRCQRRAPLDLSPRKLKRTCRGLQGDPGLL